MSARRGGYRFARSNGRGPWLGSIPKLDDRAALAVQRGGSKQLGDEEGDGEGEGEADPLPEGKG